jgi:predicted amidohydrolase
MNSPYITAAAGQLSARLMNEASVTLDVIDQLIAQAAEQKVNLLVLPECAYPAYLLGSIQSYRAGDHLSGEDFVAHLSEQAASFGLHIVSGFIEEVGDFLYNAAVLIDSTGRELGRRRKNFLWHAGHDWYTPGDDIMAYDTELGRLGVIICAETRVPEIVATLVADGAEFLAMPTCWVNTARQPGEYANIQTEYLIEARAREFGVPFICADKSGMELPPVSYVGQSRIVAADGEALATAPPTDQMLITAQLPVQSPPQLSITAEERTRLTATEPASVPEIKGPRTVTVALLPGRQVMDGIADQGPEAFFEPLQVRNAQILITSIRDRAHRTALIEAGRRLGISVLTHADQEEVFELAGLRIGCTGGRRCTGFSRPRVQALNGAEVLAFFESDMDLPVLRTRAVESRIFVFAMNEEKAVLIAPDGAIQKVADQQHAANIITEVDLSEAGNKLVAPKTDVFAGRRPGSYRF